MAVMVVVVVAWPLSSSARDLAYSSEAVTAVSDRTYDCRDRIRLTGETLRLTTSMEVDRMNPPFELRVSPLQV